MFTSIILNKFTAFNKLKLDFSPGINILIGENGTGKTHILKALYASADISTTKRSLAEKIKRVFLPYNEQIGRLVTRNGGKGSGYIEIYRESGNNDLMIRLSIKQSDKKPESAKISGYTRQWTTFPVESVFIPVKEMLANAVGFRSLYDSRKIAFEEVYADIITKALMPIPRDKTESDRNKIIESLRKAINGSVINKNEEFYLKNKQGDLEFTLLAEGFRKLGLLLILIQNDTLPNGSVLFWDEPETNLNPKLIRTVIKILIELQRMGVQIFLTTHNYVILKEFDLQIKPDDNIMYHSLYRNKETEEIESFSTEYYDQIEPNKILDTFSDLYDRELTRF